MSSRWTMGTIALGAALFFSMSKPVVAQRGENDTTLLNDVKSAVAQPEIELKRDIVYGKGGDVDLLLDLAMPKGLTHPAPAIVWIHGGAWRGGNKGEFEKPIADSARRGYVAVSIDYRLVPKHTFPAQIEDCKCAVR